MNYGIQLYSLRDTMPEDMEGTLRETAALGYKYVEFAGFFDKTAVEIKALLEKYQLEVIGTHTGLDELREHLEDTIAFHRAIGNDTIIIPGADLSAQEKLDDFIAAVNHIQPRLKQEGIRLAYHNHDHEFRPNEDGSLIYEQLLTRTELELEIDTYWVYAAGKDPLALMEEQKDRLILIHIKDGLADGSGRPLGLGTAPVPDVYEKARKMNIPMVVESETLTPDGLSEAKTCIEYLNRLSD